MADEKLIKTRWRLIPVEGEVVEGEVMWPREPSLKQLHELIDPKVTRETPRTHMEHVSVYWAFDAGRPETLDMFVDEMGHYRGMELPANRRASDIYLNAWRQRGAGGPTHHIAGPALLFDRRVWY